VGDVFARKRRCVFDDINARDGGCSEVAREAPANLVAESIGCTEYLYSTKRNLVIQYFDSHKTVAFASIDHALVVVDYKLTKQTTQILTRDWRNNLYTTQYYPLKSMGFQTIAQTPHVQTKN
tara:strand:- start:2690 stop:3055 length:366 start_codon:yes stop_codon:yes gene_type:complete